MQMTRSDDQKTMKGAADWFTGDVYIDAVADPRAPARHGTPSPTARPSS
jgi:hypothetical protein